MVDCNCAQDQPKECTPQFFPPIVDLIDAVHRQSIKHPNFLSARLSLMTWLGETCANSHQCDGGPVIAPLLACCSTLVQYCTVQYNDDAARRFDVC